MGGGTSSGWSGKGASSGSGSGYDGSSFGLKSGSSGSSGFRGRPEPASVFIFHLFSSSRMAARRRADPQRPKRIPRASALKSRCFPHFTTARGSLKLRPNPYSPVVRILKLGPFSIA
jgi:hypothetical protein